ncbi:hypothetical protein ADICYQ_5861 [Cyclobacterium qasimii M12-11B]|uniref:Uncharacterized protein n=1 Tax=Cyclobacterium qasimii M12-11B TaxID=641524 RepID=S7WM98_9BACT|nr:hypothetical protein ADICYQ_5861 [Cyclobacterium qasimii M12-11B]
MGVAVPRFRWISDWEKASRGHESIGILSLLLQKKRQQYRQNQDVYSI